MDITLFNQSKH